MKRALLAAGLILALPAPAAAGEDSTSVLPAMFGLTVRGGLGGYAVRDESISQQRYSGTLPLFMVEWSDFQETRGTRFSVEYRYSPSIRNFNASTAITEFSFGMDWLYRVGRFPLFGHEVSVCVGPSGEIFVHFRSQNFASGGLSVFKTYAFASLFSAGVNAAMFAPVAEDWLADASVGTSIVGLGGRLINPDDTQSSFFELVTAVAALRCRADAGLGCRIAGTLRVRLGYRMEISRIDAWRFFVTGSDCAVLSLHYGF